MFGIAAMCASGLARPSGFVCRFVVIAFYRPGSVLYLPVARLAGTGCTLTSARLSYSDVGQQIQRWHQMGELGCFCRIHHRTVFPALRASARPISRSDDWRTTGGQRIVCSPEIGYRFAPGIPVRNDTESDTLRLFYRGLFYFTLVKVCIFVPLFNKKYPKWQKRKERHASQRLQKRSL